MDKYSIGEKYELEVLDLCHNTNGSDYLECLGPDDHICRIYNILKCQYGKVPNTIYVEVKSLREDGSPVFKQDVARELKEIYSLNHYYAFKIVDKWQVKDSTSICYLLEDDFVRHRWYNDEGHEVGEDIILMIKKIKDNGDLQFKKHNPADAIGPSEKTIETSTETPVEAPIEQSIAENASNLPIFVGERENDKVEYKTSIVFVPGKNNEANIDKQMSNIVRSLVAFMNTEGGTLYIGIHDKTHEIVGFDNDYEHINEGEDPYKESYTKSHDGYELKIRNTLASQSSGYAGNLISIDFPQQEGATYCRIVVKKAKRPVWVKGNMLFVRQGNQTRQYFGEDVTNYICERVGRDIISIAGLDQNINLSEEEMQSAVFEAVKKAIEGRRGIVAAPTQPVVTEEVKYWIVWFNDGTWVRQKKESNAENVFKQIPIIQDAADMVVAFCYNRGTVNVVKLNDFKKGANLNDLKQNGFNLDEKPIEIFVTHHSNLLAVYSADSGGSEYIKIHSIIDARTTKAAKNKGNFIIPTRGHHVLQYKLINVTQKDNLRVLVCPSTDTTKTPGKIINDITIKEELEILSAL